MSDYFRKVGRGGSTDCILSPLLSVFLIFIFMYFPKLMTMMMMMVLCGNRMKDK